MRPMLPGGDLAEPDIRLLFAYLGDHLCCLAACNRGQSYTVKGCVCFHGSGGRSSLLVTLICHCLFHLDLTWCLYPPGFNLYKIRATFPVFNVFVLVASNIVLAAILFLNYSFSVGHFSTLFRTLTQCVGNQRNGVTRRPYPTHV